MGKISDAIVVGGGHNGLVAAHYLARGGLNVTVLERRGVVGGPCGPIEYFPGYWGAISNSPGSLEPMIVADMELERFGLEFVRPDPSMIMAYPDGRCFTAWRDKARAVEELRRFSEHDATAYYAFFDHLNDLAAKLRCSLFEPPPRLAELLARLDDPADEAAFVKILMGSLKDLLDEWFESEEIKALIGMLGVMHNQAGPSTPGTAFMLMMRPLSLASSTLMVEHDPRLQPLRGSTGLPKGGMGSITQAMARSLESRGVKIRTDAPVERIMAGRGGAEGVVLAGGEVVRGDVVVSNLNPKTTLLDLVGSDHLEDEFIARVRALSMRGSAFKIALALDGLPRFAAARDDEEARLLAACQYRISPSLDYMERAYDDSKYGRWSRGPEFWGLTPSVSDPDMAPPGKHVMSINIFHAPYRLAEGDWSSERERFGDHCIDVLTQYIPNLKDLIIDRRFWSPLDLEDEYGLLEGNISHGDMMPGRTFAMRPLAGWSNYRTPVRGLYLCGSGTWPGGLISGIPGHNGANQVVRDIETGFDTVREWASAPGSEASPDPHDASRGADLPVDASNRL